jgi:hypothetical protein
LQIAVARGQSKHWRQRDLLCCCPQRQLYIRWLSRTKTLTALPAQLVHGPLTMAYSGSMTNVSGSKDKASADDPTPPKCSVIEVHVCELKQLINAIDPSPFRDKDLDPKAEEFIVGWAKDLPRDATLALVVDLDREAGLPNEADLLRDAIHEVFSQAYRRRLREFLRVGRTSLVIGLVTLASAIALGDFLGSLLKGSRIREIVRESFTIGGRVSMWRPLEIFLYGGWPIRNEARLSERLAAMPVRTSYLNAKEPDAWRGDWPAVSPRGERASSETQPRALNQASERCKCLQISRSITATLWDTEVATSRTFPRVLCPGHLKVRRH